MHTLKRKGSILTIAIVIGLLTLFTGSALADGTETLDVPSIPINPGTFILGAGIGLEDKQPGTLNIDVPADVTIEQAILYWGGNHLNTGEFTPKDSITVGGVLVEGKFIGGDTEYAPGNVTGTYRADITALGLVTTGSNSIEVKGLDFADENYGAGLLLVLDDGSQKSQIDIRDGNDFAMIDWPPTLDMTELQTFNFDPANTDRIGSVVMFVGSVADDAGIYGFRPSSFEVTTGGTTAVSSNQLASFDGRYWDTVNLAVTVPAGAESLTTQIFSRNDDLPPYQSNLPASLVWMASGFSVTTPPKDECWLTTGGFHNAGMTAGSKDYTFGGNVGGPPRGSWEVIDHNNGDNFHSNDVYITSCEVIQLTGPDQPGGKKGFKINQAHFAGTGRLNGVDGFPFVGYVNDAGEPHGKNGNDLDSFSITVYFPNATDVRFEASATMDGGNVQIHPPNGSGK